MQQDEMCEFTKESFDDFCVDYKLALFKQKKSFHFQEREVLVDYAKYIIEYLTPKFKKK